MGKSDLCKKICASLNLKHCLIYDTMWEYNMTAYGYVGFKWRTGENAPKINREIVRTHGVNKSIFNGVCRNVLESRNVFFVIDECDKYADNTPLRYQSEHFDTIIEQGKHYGVGVLAITRRLANLSKTILGESRQVISFYQFLPNDVEVLNKFIGEKNADRSMKLKPFEYLAFKDGDCQIFSSGAKFNEGGIKK
jgi:hypothetical protein